MYMSPEASILTGKNPDEMLRNLRACLAAVEGSLDESKGADGVGNSNFTAARAALSQAKVTLEEYARSSRDDRNRQVSRMLSFPQMNPIPIIEIGLDGRIVIANPSVRKLFPDIVQHQTAHAYLAGWDEVVAKVRSDPDHKMLREVMVGDRYFEQVISFFEEYQCLRVYGVEITERKREENQLHYQASILETINDAIIVTDLEFRITFWNRAAERIYGWKAEEVLGNAAKDTLRSQLSDEVRSANYSQLLDGNPVDTVLVQLAKDGRELDIEGYTIPLRDAQGILTGFVAVNQDVTERKRREAEREQLLAQLEEQRRIAEGLASVAQQRADEMDATFTALSDAVLVYDASGKVQRANPPAVKALAFDPTRVDIRGLVGKLSSRDQDGRPIQPGRTPSARALAGETVIDDRFIMTNGEGRDVHIVASSSPLWKNGRVEGAVTVWRDVTVLEQLFNDVQRRAAELDAVITSIEDGVVIEDIHQNIVSMNPAAVRILGYSAEERGLPIRERTARVLQVTSADGKAVDDPQDFPVSRALRGETVQNVLFKVENKKSGQFVWLLNSAAPLRIPEGTIYGAVTTLTDITDRVSRENELDQINRIAMAHSKSSQVMLHAEDEASFMQDVCRIITQDCAHPMVWIGFAEHDEAKTVRAAAHAGFEEGYLDTLNLTWADVERGRGPTGTAIRTGEISLCRNMLTDPAFAPWREEAVKRGYASSIAIPLKVDGNTFGALTIYSLEADPFTKNEVSLLCEIANDLAYGITRLRLLAENKKVEEDHRLITVKLIESERKYRELVQFAPAGIYEIDFQTKKFTTVNEGMCQLTGYTREELLRMDPFDMMDGESRVLFQNRIKQWLAGKKPDENVEYRVWAKDGHEIIALLNTTFITDEKGKPLGATVIGYDITERKRAEEALRAAHETLREQAEKLEQRVQERTAELQQSAQELQTSLAMEKSLRTQLIQSEKYAALARLVGSVAHEINNPLQTVKNCLYLIQSTVLPDETREILDMAGSETQRLGKLVQQLRETYRPTSLKPVDFNLIEVLTRVYGLLTPQFNQNNVECVQHYTYNHLMLHGIPDQIHQVFLNISLNAIDAMGPAGGKFEIAVFRPKDQKQVCVSFHDTGPGISQENLGKIFEPFFTTKEKGTGLGLAICYEIVKNHGGEITVESQPGHGATFMVWLPAR
jgi:PAS domain S-box-containing protein